MDEKGVARIAGTRMKVADLVLDKMANDSTPKEMARTADQVSLRLYMDMPTNSASPSASASRTSNLWRRSTSRRKS